MQLFHNLNSSWSLGFSIILAKAYMNLEVYKVIIYLVSTQNFPKI